MKKLAAFLDIHYANFTSGTVVSPEYLSILKRIAIDLCQRKSK